METAIVPGIYEPTLADEDVRVTTEDAHALTRRLARDAGHVRRRRRAARRWRRALRGRRADSPNAVDRHDFSRRRRARTCRSRSGGACDRRCESAQRATPTRRASTRTARATYPDECCGALLGRATASSSRRSRLDNTHGGSSGGGASSIGPTTIARAEARGGRAAAAMLVGFYHSHPDHPRRPSAFDLEHAWPNLQLRHRLGPAAPAARDRARGACARIAPGSTKVDH